MINNKALCKIQQSTLYLTFLLRQIIDTFVDIEFFIFVDTISITDITSSNAITEVAAILFKYLLFSQIHVVGLQL